MFTDLIADARDICSSLKKSSGIYFKLPRGGAAMPLEKFWQVGDFSVFTATPCLLHLQVMTHTVVQLSPKTFEMAF